MSREVILERIRSQFRIGTSIERRRGVVRERLDEAARGVIPVVADSAAKRLRRFTEKATAAEASVERIAPAHLQRAVARWLREHNLPPTIRIGEDQRLDALRRAPGKSLRVFRGASDGHDLAAVSHAECAIAETGTLALLSGPDNPTSLNFLAENHIIVTRISDVVDHYEDLWDRLRRRDGRGVMPRAVNFITGPSRSADIEQTLILGAHGPVRLHIILTRD